MEALGNPLRFVLTAGQCHASTQAEALIAEYVFERLIADTSSDVAALRQRLTDSGVEVVVPPRSNRTHQRDDDQHWYKERHLVECFINRIKQYRRLFSRFDKLALRYLGFLCFAGALIWLR